MFIKYYVDPYKKIISTCILIFKFDVIISDNRDWLKDWTKTNVLTLYDISVISI